MTATSERLAGSQVRRTARASVHKVLSRVMGLPPPTTDYTVDRGVRIPMRDRVELIADHYAPTDTANAAGTLLARGPYGRGFPSSVLLARLYASRGYHVVLQSVRGTSGSGGVFEPVINEPSDGADTVEWLRHQPWFTGRFATLGQSYLGTTQWALLMDPPPELAAAIVIAGPHDYGDALWGTGAFRLTDTLGWSDIVSHQEHGSRLRGMIWTSRAQRRLAQATATLPLGESARTLLGTGAPWYESWLEHHDPADPFWAPMQFDVALDRVSVPVLLIGGWQDAFLRQTIQQYRHLRGRGVDVALTVGPWTHAHLTSTGSGRVARESLLWLDHHLKGRKGQRRSPVHIYITGDRWVPLPDWPPPTSPRVLHLAPGATLTESPPPETAGSSSFTYDPAASMPIIGGPLVLSRKGGYHDDSHLVHRGDVLSFTGSALPSDLYVVGNPKVELWHCADIPHVDMFIRISEVDQRGRSRNVCDGYRRLTVTTEPRRVDITLDAVAHRFRAGSRIRLLVSGGDHPRFARNLGTGESPLTGQRSLPATHTVFHGSAGLSRLVLPTTAGRPSGDGAANVFGNPT